jgi:hypothetical protein
MGAVPHDEGGEAGGSTALGAAGGEGGTRESNEVESVDVGTACEMLGNRRRRYALHYLKQQDDGVTEMGDLSRRVAAWEQGIDPEAVSYDERKTVHTALYQHHAPKLDEVGLIDYDSRSGRIELTDAGADVDLYLEAVANREIPWSTYFLGLSVLATLATVAAWLATTSRAAQAACGIGAALAFLVSSATFVYDSRRSMRLGESGPPPGVDEQ